MISYLISGEGNISLILKGKQYLVRKDAKNYDEVLNAIREEVVEDSLIDIIDKGAVIQRYFLDAGDIKIKDGVITYAGEEIHDSLTERIFAFIEESLPVEPLINFMRKLLANPSFSARKELFDFLDHKSLPITEDGDFLAYKAVQKDYSDKHTGKVFNIVGSIVKMLRPLVDDDRSHGCSSGFHAGTLSYVEGFGSFFDGEDSDKAIIVKINPSNVVSVPIECSCQKLRTCEYLVLMDYAGELKRNLYTDEGGEWNGEPDPENEEEDEY